MRGDDFELGVGAVVRRFVEAPSTEMRHVAEARTLHVLVGDLGDEFGAQRFPRKVLALAPAALASGHTLGGFAAAPPQSAQVFQG